MQNELEKILDVSSIIILSWRIDDDMTIESVNDGIKLLGYAPQDFISNNIAYFDIIHPDDQSCYQARFDEARNNPKCTNLSHDYRIIDFNGQVKWVDDRTVIERTEQETPIHIHSIIIDITAGKDSELNSLNKTRHELEKVNSILLEKIQELNLTQSQVVLEKEKYLRIFNNIQDVYYEASLDGEILEISKSIEHILRYSREELLGTSLYNIYANGEDRYYLIEALRDSGRVEDFEITLLDKTGEYIYCAITAEMLYEKDRRSPYIVGSIRNITNRKKTERELQQSQEKYRDVVQNASQGITVAQDGYLCFTNQKMVDMTGFSSAELASQSFLKFIHEDDRAMVAQIYGDRMKGNEVPSLYQFRVYNNRGEILWLENNGVCISWNEKPATLNFISDITSRKKSEEKLKKSELKYEELFESVLEGIGIVDEDETIQYCNPAFAKIYDETCPANMVGKNLMNYVPADRRALMLSETECRKQGKNSRYELDIITTKGRRKTLIVSVTPRFDDEGQYTGALGAVIDITETRKLQEFSSRAQRLETAGRIAGQVAHDFNNLLGPLTAYPELIRTEMQGNEIVLQYLDDMEKAAEQMAEINQQLLTLGRRGHYNLKPLNLNEILELVLEQNSPLPNSLQIVTELTSDLMNISGGKSQLLRVFVNLVSNARDAMKNVGQLVIKSENVFTVRKSGKYKSIPRGEYVRITVSDTGCGIAPDLMLNIFEPFFTTKSTDKERGSGLGLSIVHAVVEDHNGYIDWDSKEGVGTSFYLYFPITRKDVKFVNDEYIVYGKESILVVDDDDIQRSVTTNLLKKMGYYVRSVSSGEEAIKFVSEKNIDLILLDMIMPGGLDGADTLKNILKQKPHQKTVIVSGFAEIDRVDEARRIGACGFVRKPLTLKSIARAIRSAIDGEPENNENKTNLIKIG